MSDRKWSESIHLGDGGEPGGVLQTWIDGNLDTVQAGLRRASTAPIRPRRRSTNG